MAKTFSPELTDDWRQLADNPVTKRPAPLRPKPEAWLLPEHAAIIGDQNRAMAYAAENEEVVPLYRISDIAHWLRETARCVS